MDSLPSETPATFVAASLWYWLWVLVRVMNYTLVTIPSVLMSILQTSFLVTLSLLLVLLYLAVTASLCYLVVRHKYLTRYSKETKPEKGENIGKMGREIDYMTKKLRGRDKSKNYLDEFLSAIKVFGYLERPVFHELTKNMTTQKLANDEIMYLDQNLGFSIVVEGTIQVFTRVKDRQAVEYDDSVRDQNDILQVGGHSYQLLNEVKSGSPLSSLLSTLDLFRPAFSYMLVSPHGKKLDSSTPLGPLSLSPKLPARNEVYKAPNLNMSGFSQPFGEQFADTPGMSSPVYPDLAPEIVARPKPSKDAKLATIAIIPDLAFQRVQAKYPKATSHIVTMVLTRLYKVTMNAVHNYLGLTKEIIGSEVALNENTSEFKLPSYLYEGVIASFKDQQPAPDSDDELSIFSKSKKKRRQLHREQLSRYVVLASRSKPTHPGDLLSSVPLSRKSGVNLYDVANTSTDSLPGQILHELVQGRALPRVKSSKRVKENIRDRSFSDEREETEETSLRIAVVENLFKHIGIEDNPVNLHMLTMFSGNFSENSSLVGLSTLMSDNSVPISGEKYVSDSLSEGSKWDSVSSTYFPLARSSRHPHHKFYSTIHQSEMSIRLDTESISKPRAGSTSASDINFSVVKAAFAKHLEVKYFKPGATVVEQDSIHTGLFYVIDGELDVGIENKGENATFKKVYSVGAGGLAGYLSSIVGFRSLVSIKSSTKSGAIVAYISKSDFLKLMDKFYFLQLPVAARLKSLLPQLILTIDFALEWCHIPAGGILCSQGEEANGFHIVLSGRFRVVRKKDTKKQEQETLIDDPETKRNDDDYEICGEYGHGESVGEVEVLTASKRINSLIAVRDSETARIPRALFEMLSTQNPGIMIKVSRIVANRVLEANGQENTMPMTASRASRDHKGSDYKTITILPSTSNLPVKEFAEKLVQALKAIGRSVIALDQASTLTHLGRHAFDERLSQLKLSGYFAYLEEEYETVVYVCDSSVKSNWTSTCISQGDCILLLADAEDSDCATNAGDYERLLLKLKTTARTDLCLLHNEKSVIPGSTSIWLKKRIWVQGHHHIHMEIPKEVKEKKLKSKPNILNELAAKLSRAANPNIKMKLESVKSKALSSLIKANARMNKSDASDYKNDFLRLARILSNEAVGLVLGGGGSRGISHVGVVMALEKHGIPVDLIGGTSIGSFVGGLYAKDYDVVSIYAIAKKFSKRIGSAWRFIFDLTYPVTSYITGYEFNRGIWKLFGVHEIEDFWIKYFCNLSNITNSTMEIHETGYAWRFIRASMSLAGLLPPITVNGSMLLDGGYLDNLPVLEMKNQGAKYIIAVDVGSVDDRTPMSYGDTLSGFWVLFNRINPFSKHPNVPSMLDIQLRLAYVASVNALEVAKNTPGVMYLRPPIDDYATLDFLKFDDIYHVGLAYADELFTKWEKEGKLPNIAGMVASKHRRRHDKRRRERRYSI